MDEFRQFGSIIIVTKDAILERCMSNRNRPEKIGSHGQSHRKKITGSEKNRVGRETGTTGIFLGLSFLKYLPLI
jgi:hypothetical protein